MKKTFKKIAAVTLSCVLTLGMSLNAFAANDPGTDLIDSRGEDTPATAKTGMINTVTNFPTGNTSSRDVSVKIEAPDKVYRVDVKWESTKFTFKIDGNWSPEDHKYGDGATGKFYVGEGEKNNALITVTNHSNDGVNIAYAYEAKTSTNGFTAAIYNSNGTDKQAKASGAIVTAEGTAFGSAPSDSAYIVVSGYPTDTTKLTDVTIGTVTVTISKQTSTT